MSLCYVSDVINLLDGLKLDLILHQHIMKPKAWYIIQLVFGSSMQNLQLVKVDILDISAYSTFSWGVTLFFRPKRLNCMGHATKWHSPPPVMPSLKFLGLICSLFHQREDVFSIWILLPCFICSVLYIRPKKGATPRY